MVELDYEIGVISERKVKVSPARLNGVEFAISAVIDGIKVQGVVGLAALHDAVEVDVLGVDEYLAPA